MEDQYKNLGTGPKATALIPAVSKADQLRCLKSGMNQEWLCHLSRHSLALTSGASTSQVTHGLTATTSILMISYAKLDENTHGRLVDAGDFCNGISFSSSPTEHNLWMLAFITSKGTRIAAMAGFCSSIFFNTLIHQLSEVVIVRPHHDSRDSRNKFSQSLHKLLHVANLSKIHICNRLTLPLVRSRAFRATAA